MRNAPASPRRSSGSGGRSGPRGGGGARLSPKGVKGGLGVHACACMCRCVHACACACMRVHVCAGRTVCARRCVCRVRVRARTRVYQHPCQRTCTCRVRTRAVPCPHVCACVPARPGSPPPPVGAPRPSLPARVGVPVGRGWERGACVIMPVAMETICSPGAGAAWARGRWRGGGGGSGAAAGCKGLGKGTAPWGHRGSLGMVVAPWGHHGSVGTVTAQRRWSRLCRDGRGSVGDGHRSLGTVMAPWDGHDSARMVTSPWGRSELHGDSHSSAGVSRLPGISHGNCSHPRVPPVPMSLLSLCPSRPHVPPVPVSLPWAGGGLGPLVGARAGERDGHTWVQGHVVPVPTCWDPQGPPGATEAQARLGGSQVLGGWPLGHCHTKTQDFCDEKPAVFTAALQRLRLRHKKTPACPVPGVPSPPLSPTSVPPTPSQRRGDQCPLSHRGAGEALWGIMARRQRGASHGMLRGMCLKGLLGVSIRTSLGLSRGTHWLSEKATCSQEGLGGSGHCHPPCPSLAPSGHQSTGTRGTLSPPTPAVGQRCRRGADGSPQAPGASPGLRI